MREHQPSEKPSESTIRELLIPPFSQNQATALAERVEVVLKLHSRSDLRAFSDLCRHCQKAWPCPTIRALNGEA